MAAFRGHCRPVTGMAMQSPTHCIGVRRQRPTVSRTPLKRRSREETRLELEASRLQCLDRFKRGDGERQATPG